ncbi:MAG: hypothetical protein GY796_20760 [Chloroflexi bacterium]|nr:hypothetical protein [Chloroflexota bacterium]
MSLEITPRKTALFLTAIACLLVLAHAAMMFSLWILDHGNLFGLVNMFSLDKEANVPTLYASATLILCSLLLLLIAFSHYQMQKPYVWHWLGLAALFGFLAMDETARIHELLIGPVNVLFNKTSGYYSWLIPYSIILTLISLAYVQFFFRLPLRTRLRFFLAGSIFMLGVVAMEIISEGYFEYVGEDLLYVFFFSVEEILEMTGIILFVHALVSYFSEELNGIQIAVPSTSPIPVQKPASVLNNTQVEAITTPT